MARPANHRNRVANCLAEWHQGELGKFASWMIFPHPEPTSRRVQYASPDDVIMMGHGCRGGGMYVILLGTIVVLSRRRRGRWCHDDARRPPPRRPWTSENASSSIKILSKSYLPPFLMRRTEQPNKLCQLPNKHCLVLSSTGSASLSGRRWVWLTLPHLLLVYETSNTTLAQQQRTERFAQRYTTGLASQGPVTGSSHSGKSRTVRQLLHIHAGTQ
jgi:hypothetical protein